MYWIDKVIDEIKWRCGNKYNIDGIQWMINSLKHPCVPAPDEGVAVVEIETEPVEAVEEHKGEAEEPKLPESEGWEACPECWEVHDASAKCGESDSKESEKCEEESETSGMEAVTETKEDLDNPTPEEEDRMNKILDAIKTFFPNENTEDVLVRIVSKLIDR